MSYWKGTHKNQKKLEKLEGALPLFGASNNEKYSDSTNDDLTEASNLLCLVHDFYNNGSLGANIEARISRYNEECKYGQQMFKDWFEQVLYWWENDCMPSDEEQDWYCTQWIDSMLESIDFDFDESPPSPKREPPKPPKRKRDEPPNNAETEAKAKLDQMFKVARAEPAKKRRVTYKCSKCGEPKKGHTCPKTPEAKKPTLPPKKPKVPVALAPETKPKFAVTKAEFMQYKAYQRCSAYGLPQWFMTDDAKASEVMNKYNELATYYNI